MEDARDLHRSFDDLRQDRFVLGSPAEVCAELERYQELVAPSHVVFRMSWPGLPSADTRNAIELMGDEVIPYV